MSNFHCAFGCLEWVLWSPRNQTGKMPAEGQAQQRMCAFSPERCRDTCPRESPVGAGEPHFRPCWGSLPLTEIARGPATPADLLHSVSTTETSPVGPGWVCKRSGACTGEPRFLNAALFKRALGTGALPSFGVRVPPHARFSLSVSQMWAEGLRPRKSHTPPRPPAGILKT